MAGFDDWMVDAIVIAERVAASISVLCTLISITAYLFHKEFRTFTSMLILCATPANLLCGFCALIGGSAVSRINSPLCQTQAFLLEWFMQADPIWSLVVAFNAYLRLFHRFSEEQLRKSLWKFLLFGYGVPLIPALYCLFYKTEAKGRMYGDATFWCWIDSNWAPVRMFSYYIPIWISIFCSSVFYAMITVKLRKCRRELRLSQVENFATMIGIRTTEVQVTNSLSVDSKITHPTPVHHGSPQQDLYSITISSNTRPSKTKSKKRSFFGDDEVQAALQKTTLRFAAAIAITWIIPTINRVYGLVHPKDPSFALSFLSALLLPLQGFWTAVVFFFANRRACETVWKRWTDKGEVFGNKIPLTERRGSGSTATFEERFEPISFKSFQSARNDSQEELV